MSYVPELSDLNLKDVDTVAIDLETYDPNLKTLGSGAIRGNGKVCGIAIAYKDEKLYFPIRHSDSASKVGVANSNIAPNLVWKILNKKIFQNKNITKVFHNAMYDVCWIRQESGLMVQGPIVDTMIAASIIDENRISVHSYSYSELNVPFYSEKEVYLQLFNKLCERSSHEFSVVMEIKTLPHLFKNEWASESYFCDQLENDSRTPLLSN